MGPDGYLAVSSLAEDVRALLQDLDLRSLQRRPNSFEPTVAESLALALLELDRIASEARIQSRAMPPFANHFLNRRLSRRLLERYHGRDLAAEFERRLHGVLERLANGHVSNGTERALDDVSRLLSELRSALLHRQGSAANDA